MHYIHTSPQLLCLGTVRKSDNRTFLVSSYKVYYILETDVHVNCFGFTLGSFP